MNEMAYLTRIKKINRKLITRRSQALLSLLLNPEKLLVFEPKEELQTLVI